MPLKTTNIKSGRHSWGNDNYTRYNPTKTRSEWWYRCDDGDREYTLGEVYPGREWRDRFMSAPVFFPTLLGLQSELPWHVNGIGQAGGGVPDIGCFTPANEIGGGLSQNVEATGADNDYTAIHWGGNYPVLLRKSPHYHCALSPQQITEVAYLAGLVDSTRKTGTNAFGVPDNGVFFHFDTDVHTVPHFFIRSNSVNVTDVDGVLPTAGAHIGVHIQTNDAGDKIRFIFGGSVVVDWVDVSGAAYAALRTAQLQPYFAVVNRRAPVTLIRELHLHDFRLIEDRGF